MHSSFITSSILGGQLTTTTFPLLENFRQRMNFSRRFTVNNLINEFKSLKYQRVFFPCTCSGLLVANVGLLSFLLGDGDGVFPDIGISPGEIGLVCSPDFSSIFLTECFSGLPKNCVFRLLLPDDLELVETCESLSPSPLFFSFLFSGLILSAVLVSSDLFTATPEVVPIFASVFPSLLCEVIIFSVSVNCWPSSELLCVLFFSVIGTEDIGQSILSNAWLVPCTSFVEIGTTEIGHSSVVCASGLFATGGTTCTSCSGELLEDIVRSIIPPLGTSRSTFGDAMYLAARVGGFFFAIFVNEEYTFIVLACSLSNVANGPSLFSASEFSVDDETGETSGLGKMCTGLFGLLELHWCNGFLGVLAAGVFVPKSEQYTDLNFALSDMWFFLITFPFSVM